jgi:hypothetical protein
VGELTNDAAIFCHPREALMGARHFVSFVHQSNK